MEFVGSINRKFIRPLHSTQCAKHEVLTQRHAQKHHKTMVYAEPKLLLKSSPAGVRTSADASDAEENMPLRSAADGGAATGVKWHMAGAPLAPALHIGMEPVIE